MVLTIDISLFFLVKVIGFETLGREREGREGEREGGKGGGGGGVSHSDDMVKFQV